MSAVHVMIFPSEIRIKTDLIKIFPLSMKNVSNAQKFFQIRMHLSRQLMEPES